MADYLTQDTACIALNRQPSLLLELGRLRGAEPALLLREAGIPAAGLLDPQRQISPQQYLQLLGQLLRHGKHPELPFLLGQNLLPGHYGAVSHALLQAADAGQALQLLVQYQSLLCPLLTPHLHLGPRQAVLYWTPAYACGSLLPALVEMHLAAVTAMCRWLGDAHLPWRYSFNRTRPRHIEQHQVHLGQQLHFNAPLDALLIERDALAQPWPRGNRTAVEMMLPLIAAQEGAAAARRSLLALLYDWLQQAMRTPPTLEAAASQLRVSPATLKRHLAREGTHFQAELDQARAHVSLYLLHERHYSNEAIATHLGYHDANNFRRAFKRWTGQTPGLLRSDLDAAG